MVTLELTRTCTLNCPKTIRSHILIQNVSAKVSVTKPDCLATFRVSAETCRPRFSFFHIQFSKNGHCKRNVIGFRFWASAKKSVACAALQMISTRANDVVASGAPPSLCRYIVGGPSMSQQAFSTFCDIFSGRAILLPNRPFESILCQIMPCHDAPH